MATTIPSERQFHHPFKPYAIQYGLMNAVYDCIAESKVGIFESPTGTGKSLSLICSCLTWLQDERRTTFTSAAHLEGDEDEPAWILEQAQRQRTDLLLQCRLDLESRLMKVREKESRQKRQYEKGEPIMKRAKLDDKPGLQDEKDGSQFILDDYESEDGEKTVSAPQGQGDGLSTTTMKLMRELGEPCGPVVEDQDELPDELKIYFCSRTHSQLTQFVNELRRVKIPQASWLGNARSSVEEKSQPHSFIKHLPLGSRKNLCINPKVIDAGSTATINERCLDLQRPSTPQDQKCPFIPNKEKQVLVNEFRDHTLAKVRDIEDLGSLGKQIGICPYYSARASIKPSEVVVSFLCGRGVLLTSTLHRSSPFPIPCYYKSPRGKRSVYPSKAMSWSLTRRITSWMQSQTSIPLPSHSLNYIDVEDNCVYTCRSFETS